MITVIPAIEGKIGSTAYYEATMKVQDFVNSVSSPTEMDNWEDVSIEERMQRNPDTKRIAAQLEPYIANNPDRFFGSIIVLIYEGEVTFDSITRYTSDFPIPYQPHAHKMGFLTIDENASLLVLDGQHRLIALKNICNRKIFGAFSNDVTNDEICVIFIRHEDKEKTRRIFNTVNRYAKQTSRGDNIITSEDDGYAIISRRLLQKDAPFAKPAGMESDIVNWRSNTLTNRSIQFTTISVVYETVKLILDHYNIPKFKQHIRPTDDELAASQSHCEYVWQKMLTWILPYKSALQDPTKIPDFRRDDAKQSLLFKPAAQIALVDGILRAVTIGEISLDTVVNRVNLVEDWSMSNKQWRGVIIKTSLTIDASLDGRRRMAKLICYLIAADCLSADVKFDIWQTYNLANGIDIKDIHSPKFDDQKLLALPKPVEGDQYTVKEGKARALMTIIPPL